jgi:hypothetical protein
MLGQRETLAVKVKVFCGGGVVNCCEKKKDKE